MLMPIENCASDAAGVEASPPIRKALQRDCEGCFQAAFCRGSQTQLHHGLLDETPSQHVSFEQGMPRVWKKVSGQWKVAAVFVRALDTAFVPVGN